MSRRRSIDGVGAGKYPMQVKCSERQYDRWQQLAAESGLTLSEWVRYTLDHFGQVLQVKTETTTIVKIRGED